MTTILPCPFGPNPTEGPNPGPGVPEFGGIKVLEQGRAVAIDVDDPVADAAMVLAGALRMEQGLGEVWPDRVRAVQDGNGVLETAVSFAPSESQFQRSTPAAAKSAAGPLPGSFETRYNRYRAAIVSREVILPLTRRSLLKMMALPAATVLAQEERMEGMASCGIKAAPRSKPSGIPFHTRFTDIGQAAGLTHPVVAGHPARADYVIEAMSCGVAFFDYDNDGWLDTDASTRLYKKNRDGAYTDVTKAVSLFGRKPDDACPRYLRAKIYSGQQETAKLAAELEQAVAQTRLGSALLDAGNADEAVPHLRDAARLDSGNQSTLNTLQLALRRDGQIEEANVVRRELSEVIRRRDTGDQKLVAAFELANRGVALEKQGDLPGAVGKYRAALGLLPDHAGIRTNLAIALLEMGRWQEGIGEMREALRRNPGNNELKKALEDALTQAKAQGVAVAPL